jgi:hypothetical protein
MKSRAFAIERIIAVLRDRWSATQNVALVVSLLAPTPSSLNEAAKGAAGGAKVKY